MPQASDYAYIRAWNEFLGMSNEHSALVAELAAAGEAPLDAIYGRTDGTWATVGEIEDKERFEQIDARAKELQDEEDTRRAEEADAAEEARQRAAEAEAEEAELMVEQEAADATRNADQEEGQDPNAGVDAVRAERDADSIDEGAQPEPSAE